MEHVQALNVERASYNEEKDSERISKDAAKIGAEVDKNPEAEKKEAARLEQAAQNEKDKTKKAEDEADAAAIKKVEALSESDAADAVQMQKVAKMEHEEALKQRHASYNEELDAESTLEDAGKFSAEVDKNPEAEKEDAAILEKASVHEA